MDVIKSALNMYSPDMVLVAYAQATTQLPTAVCAPINPGAGSWAKAPTNNGAAGTS